MIRTGANYILLGITMLLSGCIPLNIVKDLFRPVLSLEKREPDYTIDIQSFRIPAPGETVIIQYPKTKQEMEVVFTEVYTSASGTWCARFNATNNSDGKYATGLACLDNRMEWQGRILELKELEVTPE